MTPNPYNYNPEEQKASLEVIQGKQEHKPVNRWLARVIDNIIYSIPLLLLIVPFFFIMALIFGEVMEGGFLDLMGFALHIPLSLLCVLFESILLSTWGTTPGKALLKIKVRQANGEKLTFGQALKRSMEVWFFGLAMGGLIPLASIASMIWAYRRLDSEGTTHWDQSGGFVVTYD